MIRIRKCGILFLLLNSLFAFSQKSHFRGEVFTAEYWEHPNEQRERQAAVLSDLLKTTRENWDTLYATFNVCSDTIIMTYHGLDPSVSHMTFEFGSYSFVKTVDPKRGIEFVKTRRMIRDLSGATSSDWKEVRNNNRDSSYQDYDYRMVHPKRQYDTYYASIDESEKFNHQFKYGGYFEFLFHPRGRYVKLMSISDPGKHFTDYRYVEDEDLDCAAMLEGVQIRPRDEALDQLVQTRPNSNLIPKAERKQFNTVGILDSNAFSQINLDAYRGNYLLVDLWATWCLPCRQEMPFLAEIDKRYREKPLKVVSISLDGKIEEARWREARNDLAMYWENWIALEGMEGLFAYDYVETGIPVYLLIDPEGQVISKNAPRPSSNELVTLLDQLLKDLE